MDEAIAELDAQFGIPGLARIVAGNGGLAKVSITSPAATGEEKNFSAAPGSRASFSTLPVLASSEVKIPPSRT